MPIVTLTTDIGQRDFLIGAMKGQFLQLDPSFVITDITHYLSKSNYPEAAYICSNAYRYYPKDSFHLLIANLFDAPLSHLLLARYQDQWIICADNGLLTMITGQKPQEVVAVPLPAQKNLLDITGVAAKAIHQVYMAGGNMQAAGSPISQINEKYPLRPMIGPDWMEGQILFIDHFENVVVNITKEEFLAHRGNRNFKIVFKRNEVIETISDNYTSVSETDKLAWFNSAGYLEIALRNGNMAGLFGLQGFNEQLQSNTQQDTKWFYQTVRVFFE